ncbi:hypothetical protein [Candidatus Avelusimicrobium caledoniensis]|uniref:hypothetical protein n=1 Tax=Candidatus Avelusimicrobium caledoniensis TaxID=3416220 RepID=UPI003D117529
MNGWQRFGILFLCCFFVMVLFPEYDKAGWTFIGLIMLMWTGAIMMLSLITNVFGLDRFDWFNRLLTLAVFCGIMYTLLWYFPQTDKVSPVNKLKYGEYPTMSDIKKGVKKLTFNFNFATRGVEDRHKPLGEKVDEASKQVQKTAQQIKKEAQSFIEIVDEEKETYLED